MQSLSPEMEEGKASEGYVSNRDLDALVAKKVMGRDESHYHYTEIPNYSTAIGPAFDVVVKMREWEWLLGLWVETDGSWTCQVQTATWEGQETAKTAPEAICRAALAACKEKGK